MANSQQDNPLFMQDNSLDYRVSRKKRYRKPRRCEACGKEDVIYSPPNICHDCRILLREAWEANHLADKKMYRVLAYISTSASSRLTSPITDAMKGLARVIDFYEGNGMGLESGRAIGSDSHMNDWRWVMTERQALLVENALKALETVVDEAFREGFKKGRSLIQGMAEGSLSADTVNEWCEHYGVK